MSHTAARSSNRRVASFVTAPDARLRRASCIRASGQPFSATCLRQSTRWGESAAIDPRRIRARDS
jgi:hypothetical protein